MPSVSNGNVSQLPQPIQIPVEHYDADESRPLLSANRNISYNTQDTSFSLATSRLEQLGWIEFGFPDGAVYYVQPNWKVVCDADFRDEHILHTVSALFDGAQTGNLDDDTETWVLPTSSVKKGKLPKLERWIVDHSRRGVIGPAEMKKHGKGKEAREEEGLDMEYRYWCFMETHPAHVPLPSGARGDAMDILTWAWTGQLFVSASQSFTFLISNYRSSLTQ